MPRIGMTMGDPAGVGPEICLQAANHPAVLDACQPVIFGDFPLLERVAERCNLPLPQQVVESPDALAGARPEPTILHLDGLVAGEVLPGDVNAATGHAAYRYVDAAIDAALAGQIEAIATGPIHKEAWQAAGVPFPGHTEILASKTGCPNACMMLTAPEITCSLVTTHIGYHEVPSELSVERVLEVIELSHQAMLLMRGFEPRLAVCGLNPHAGEHGLFGNREEERIILPAIQRAQAKGIQVEGPLPPDTAFVASRRRVTDCYVCMYHDQGLIPLKALAFDEAVNVTLGLPIVRTSVDHGTALDIAWQGQASYSSMLAAIFLAVKLCQSPQPV